MSTKYTTCYPELETRNSMDYEMVSGNRGMKQRCDEFLYYRLLIIVVYGPDDSRSGLWPSPSGGEIFSDRAPGI